MPYCSKCKREKENMHSPKTCEECSQSSADYYACHKEQQAKTNKLWRATKNGQEKQQAASNKWRKNNPERYKELVKSYTKKNSTKPSYRLNKAKQKAKSRGIEFNLTLEEYSIAIDKPCYYCAGAFGKVTKGSGLDRIDCSKGYIVSNIVSCCNACNRIKSDIFSTEETKVAAEAIIAYRLSNPL